MDIVLAVPDPGDWFVDWADAVEDARQPDHIDLFGILAEAAAEIKSAADILYGTRRLPAETLASARAAAERAIAAIDEHRSPEGT